MTQYKYWCGKRFYKSADGSWLPCTTNKFRNRFGVPTTSIRVPVCMVPFLSLLLDKMAEVETVRRNLSSDVLNTSPDVFFEDVNIFFSEFNEGAKDE